MNFVSLVYKLYIAFQARPDTNIVFFRLDLVLAHLKTSILLFWHTNKLQELGL